MIRLLSCFLFLFFFSTVFAQDKEADSLKRLLKSPLHDTSRLAVMYALVEALPDGQWENYNEQMRILADKKVSESVNDKILLPVYLRRLRYALHNEGVAFVNNLDDVKALESYEKSLRISKQLGDKKDIAGTGVEIGKLYMRQGKHAQAIEIYFESLKIFEEVNDFEGIGDAQASIAFLYNEQGKYPAAIDFYGKAFNNYKKINNRLGMFKALYRKAYIYSTLENYEEALKYLSQSSDILNEEERKAEAITISNNLAVVYYAQHKPEKALTQYKISLRLAEERNQWPIIGQCCYSLCDISRELKDYKSSIVYGEKGLSVMKKFNDQTGVALLAKILSKSYKQQGNYKMALEKYEEVQKAKDQLYTNEAQQSMLAQQFKYEYEKKELLEKAANDKKFAMIRLQTEQEQERKNRWIIILIALSVLILVGTAFLYNFIRQKNLIASQKESILKQKLLVSQMNPHFIFNSLNAIQNYIFKQDSLKAGNYLSQFAELIRMILEYSRKDQITLEQEIKLLENYLGLQQLRFDYKFDYSLQVGGDLDPALVLIPPMLAQPFIENAIEHGIFYKEGKGTVQVRIYRMDEQLVYEIEDDGVGLERSAEQNKKTRTGHRSLAVIITRERIQAMEGGEGVADIEIQDKSAIAAGLSGVKVKFVIPYQEV